MGLVEEVTMVVPTSRRDFLRAAAVTPLLSQPAESGRLRDLFGRYLHCVNRRDAYNLARLFAEGAEYRDLTFGVRLVGRDAIRNMFARTFAAVADSTFLVKSSALEGETIAVRWESTGRHEGPMLGMPGSGRLITLRGASFLTVAGDRVAEQVDYLDRSGLERQLGIRGASRE
jgi:steroid delta-isomerase-like uncharacterized protein